MVDRLVSWKAVADFTSLLAENKKAQKSIRDLRNEQTSLADSFESDSNRISAAAAKQNKAIGDSGNGFQRATQESKKNADSVVRDSKRKESAYNAEANTLNNLTRANRELEVASKKNADMGQRMHTINQALAQASKDVADAEQRRAVAQEGGNKSTRESVQAERDLLNARRSSQRLAAAKIAAERDIAKAIAEASKEEEKAANVAERAAAARQRATAQEIRDAANLANARANLDRTNREHEAATIRNTRANRDSVASVAAVTAAERSSSEEVVRGNNIRKTFLQTMQSIQASTKAYKGTVDSVTAAQTAHARATARSLAASRSLETLENNITALRNVSAKSENDLASAEQKSAAIREVLSHATDDVANAETAASAARSRYGRDSAQAVAAENELVRARSSAARVQASLDAVERDGAVARHSGEVAARGLEGAEQRLVVARQRSSIAGTILTRATTKLNGEMNASQSIIRQTSNAFQALTPIFEGMSSGVGGLLGMFGKLALTLLPQLLPLLGVLAGGFTAVTSSILGATGVLAALPSLLLGAVTGFAALKGAFSGIGKAMKAYDTEQASSAATAKAAAKTARDNARAIADAQKSLSEAKRNAAEADKTAAANTIKAVQDAAAANKKAAQDVIQAKADQVKAVKDAARNVSDAEAQAASDIARANDNVTSAEKTLTAAQEQSAIAQRALNNIRGAAIQELEDMKKAARDASFSERDATLNLIDARNKLAAVKEDPNASDSEVAKAQLQYEEAQAQLSDAEQAKQQAVKANADAQKAGITGTQAYTNAQQTAAQAAQTAADAQASLAKAQADRSKTIADAAQSIADAESNAAEQRAKAAQQVTQALAAQTKTQKDGFASMAAARASQAKTERSGAESVLKAQEGVARAMQTAADATDKASRSANAYQTAMAKLTPSQRQFVQFLIGLKPKLNQLRETAAKNLLPGVEAGIRGVMPLFPAFNASIGNTAKAFGDASSRIGKTLGSGEGFGAMKRVFATNDAAIKEAAGSSGHYTIALARVMDAARPLVTWIGHLVAVFGQYLDKTSKTNKENGDLAKFMDSAKKSAQLFGGILKNIGGILWGLGKASKGAGDDLNHGFLKHLEKINKSVNSVSGQDKLSKWFNSLKAPFKAAGHVIGNLVRSIGYLAGLGKDEKGKSGGGLGNLTYMLDQLANGVGPNSPLIQFFAKLNKSGSQKKTFDAIGGLFKAFTDFGNGPGGTVFNVMATEIGAISKALGVIASNKAGAALLTGIMVAAGTMKVAKFAGQATGISTIGRAVSNSAAKRKAAGKRSLTNRVTGGRVGRGATTPAAGVTPVSEGEAVGNGVTTGINTTSPNVTRAATTMATNALNAIDKKFTVPILNAKGERIGTYVSSGILASDGAVNTAASTMASGALTNIEKKWTVPILNSRGEMIGSGIATGINASTGSVNRATNTLAEGVLTSLKTKLEIHSPSKVTTRYGEWTGQGFVNGVDSKVKNATTAAEALETATIKGISSADDKMLIAGEKAGSAYAKGLKTGSKGAGISSKQIAAGTRTTSPVVVPEQAPARRMGRGAAVRGAVGGAGTAAMMGSMFLPGKAGEVAGQAGMALMMVSMLPKLETVVSVVKKITAALKLQTIAQKLGAAAAKAYAAMQLLVNTAMEANPIFLVIGALVLLGIAFVVLWKKSETFRKIVTGAWEAIKKAAVATYDWFKNIGSTIFDALKSAANSVFGWLKKNWKLILAILTAPFGGVYVYLAIKFWPQIKAVLTTVWNWIKGAFAKLWSGVKAVFMAPFNAAKALINQFTDSRSGLRHILSSVVDWVKGVFSRAWAGIKKIFTDPIGAAKTAISNILGKTGLQKVFSGAMSAISRIWAGLKKVISDPINAVIGVINKPFISGFNAIAGKISKKLKIPTIPTIGGRADGGYVPTGHLPGRAAGGIIPGPWKGPKADNVLGVSDRGVPTARVNPGEYITKVSSTQKMKRKHPGALEYINTYGELPRHREGGEISDVVNTVKFALSKVGGPYVWGGEGPTGYDCSGLTSQAWKHGAGVHLTHLAQAQHDTDGLWPVSRGNLIPGDLVFPTKGARGQIPHVAMYVGENQIVEAANPNLGIIGPHPMGTLQGGARRPLTGSSKADSGGIMSKLGGALLSAAKKGGSFIGNIGGALFNGLKNIINKPLSKAMSIFPGSDWATSILPGTAKNLVSGVIDWGKDKAKSLLSIFGGNSSSSGNSDNGGVSRWREAVSEGLAANHLPATNAAINAWLRQIQSESGGNPNAIQHGYTDVNTLSGNLARGLLQVIPPTFRQYMFPGHDNITAPYDNILAAINYAKHRYGTAGMYSVVGHGHGYSEGGYTGSGGKYEPAGVVHKGEVVWSQKDVAAHGGAHKVDAMRTHRGSKIPGYATGGIVAPPSGQPINSMLKPGGNHMLAYKMIKELLALKTKRGMRTPVPDNWDSSVSAAFVKRGHRVSDLPIISHDIYTRGFLAPLTKLLRYNASQLPGKTRMESYPALSPANAKLHPSITRILQKVIGIKQDGVWGDKMSKALVQWKRDKGIGSSNSISRPTWRRLAEDYAPNSYGGPGATGSPTDKRIRVEDVANRYGISMWQAARLGQGSNADFIKKHTLAASNQMFLKDSANFSASTGLGGSMIKSYQSMFGKPRDGVWSTGMADWMTYAMRKQMGVATDTIFPPWWTLDPLQKGIEDQDKSNKDQAEFLKDLDILSGWGLGYLVDKLQSDGPEEGLPVARIAIKNKTLASQYDSELKKKSELDATGTEDYTKFVATVMAPGIQQGIRSVAQNLGIADFAVVDMYDKLLKSGRLNKGERTSRLDREVSQFKKGLFYAATGGQVPGTGTGDRVPAMLTPGEFVLRKSAVKAIGLENLYNLNNMQHFANGGQVYSFNEMSRGFGTVGPIDYSGLSKVFASRVPLTKESSSRSTLEDSKVVNNYTTINNPVRERSTASINRQLRKNAALGFMAVRDDSTKVNN